MNGVGGEGNSRPIGGYEPLHDYRHGCLPWHPMLAPVVFRGGRAVGLPTGADGIEEGGDTGDV